MTPPVMKREESGEDQDEVEELRVDSERDKDDES